MPQAFVGHTLSLYEDYVRGLLLGNPNRKNQISTAYIVNDIQTLHDLTKAGVDSVQVLSVLAVHADKEL